MRKISKFLIVILLSTILSGCGKRDMTGIILEVTENEVLLSQNLTSDEYKEIEEESITTLLNENLEGERANLDLIVLTYENTDELSEGNQVDVWIDGDILLTYPSQAKAKKIKSQDSKDWNRKGKSPFVLSMLAIELY